MFGPNSVIQKQPDHLQVIPPRSCRDGPLVRSVFVALHSFTIFAPGQKVAEIDTAWGSTAPVTVSQPVDVIGWPGLVATLEVRHRPLDGPLASGATVGTLQAGVGSISAHMELRTASALSGPGVWWRLTR